MTEEKQKRERQNMVGLLLWKKKSFKVGFERVQSGFLSERKGNVIPCTGDEDGKGTRTNGGEKV